MGKNDLTDGQLRRLIQDYAPREWKKIIPLEELRTAINETKPLRAIVLVADIRRSTELMEAARDLGEFAKRMSRYFSKIRELLKGTTGWFGAFTGDGFIAYWLEREYDTTIVATSPISLTGPLRNHFKDKLLPIFELPDDTQSSRVDLAFGLDAGEIYLVRVGNSLTILGRPVVEAVRMVELAREGRHVLLSESLGQKWIKDPDMLSMTGWHIKQVRVKPKASVEKRAYQMECSVGSSGPEENP